MQKPINYLTFFNFFIHIPIAIFKNLSKEEIEQECFKVGIIPIAYIKDKKHPLFIQVKKGLKERGVKQKLKLIVLPIGYHKEYLS